MLTDPKNTIQDDSISDDSTDEDERLGLKRVRTDHLKTLPPAKHPHLSEEVY